MEALLLTAMAMFREAYRRMCSGKSPATKCPYQPPRSVATKLNLETPTQSSRMEKEKNKNQNTKKKKSMGKWSVVGEVGGDVEEIFFFLD